jgi:hypothetical protein
MSIVLGKAINILISGATSGFTGSTAINGHIYPIVIPEGITMPVVVYERESELEYTRDGSQWYNSQVTIYVLTGDYGSGVNIAEKIINKFNNYRGTATDKIIDSRIKNIQESVNDQIYLQKIEINIKNY